MIAIAVVFLFGVATTVYLSLRSPEVKVPDVVGKDRYEAEKILEEADLKYRVRASRPTPTNQAQPDTVLFQLPRAGEVVKTGQTVAMDISRPAKAGESPETVTPADEPSKNRNTNASANANENKPRKPKPKNENDNLNGNVNTNTNANRSANANRANENRTNENRTNVNRPNANTTVDNINAAPRSNTNQRNTSNVNQRNTNSRPASTNVNDNRRPVLRPTPAVPRPDR